LQTGTCAGSSVIVRYRVTGGSFSTGNRFTAQLSNAFGQFTNPVTIGTSNFNLGIILATLPRTTTFGFLYRIRVVSSNPAVIGSASPNTVIVTSTAITATIRAQPDTLICPNDTVRLTALLPNARYEWSTGATTQSITVRQAGSYWVKVTDQLGCDARDTVVIRNKTGCVVTGNAVNGIKVFPNPVSSSGTLTLVGIPSGYNKLQLVDALGRVAAVYTIAAGGRVRLADYSLSQGIYKALLLGVDETLFAGKIFITHQ
jgi:hypothetical protein